MEAETDNCVSGAGLVTYTDEWFSYDKDGHVTDIWELTPNSGTYYHSVATFAGNGAVTKLTLPEINPSFAAVYGLDGEGRWNALAMYGQTIVPAVGVSYNAAGQPLTIDIGSGSDNDTYTYDPETGRMQTWDFTVNSVSENATINWNPNWTLKSLVITDGFNSGGTQTCNFNSSLVTGTGYDDLGRLIGSSCAPPGGTAGSTWNQADSYDQYDNLTKSSTGFVSWNPGYSITSPNSNNHYTCTGCTYDLNGDVTNDGTNTYTWDGFNKLSSVNASGAGCSSAGECITYDALGRMVEVDNGSTKTEILYTQLGKTAYMNGSSFSYAYWPAPGGGTLLQDAGYSYYYQHKDWLGNVRLSSSANESHNVIIGDYAYAPYGEKYNIFGSTAQNQTMFTGDTQDVLAGMYDTPNRELQGSQQGRWLSPDPAGSGWNQYAYATNPNSQVDPSGLDDDDDDGGDGSGGVGLGSSSGVPEVYAPDVQADLIFSGTPMGLNTNGDYSDGASMLAALNPMSFNPATGEDTSDIDISSDMVNNANALAPALGHGNDFMQGAVAAVGFQAGIAGAIFAGPAVASAAVNRLLFGPALNRVFWYGAGYFAASSYAATSEGTMLGDTPVGSVLDFFTRPIAGGFGFGWETMQPYWASASQMFAQGAQGPVLMFPGIVANPASIWFTEELPALTDNGTQIITMGP